MVKRTPRSFRGDHDGRVFMFGTVHKRGERVAYSLELMGRNTRDPADGRDLAHELLRYAIGDRAAGAYAQAFRDEVLFTLPPDWSLSAREIVDWLQAR